MDFGGVYKGYCGDMTRTIAIEHVTDKQREVYDIVLQSQLAGIEACKAGVSCKAVDDASRSIIEKAGYGEYYIHGTGHGVGTQVHEAPTLNARSSETLESYMAVTIEPGIYIPDEFGVRIEDLAIVTNFGIINLVQSPKGLIII
jgi:Xaa-Pro aminopeptidase